MSQSLSNILIHIVFSTKGRQKLLHEKIRQKLYAYIIGIFKTKSCNYYQLGGVDDHIHISCSLPKTISVSDLIKEIKTSTSIWLKTKDNNLENFHWQTGYGVFSVSPAHLQGLCEYIANQEEHHKVTDFKEEFLGLLNKYKINYDERYLWD
ncbi:MAG: transposase [uncultured bacterium]|nr:MAG: transposase [uncultured bacterium]